MTKGLVIGLATVAVSGATLLGTGMYAATTTTDSTNQAAGFHGGRGMGGGENMVNSLSGKVSTEALTALQTLMTKHKAAMDGARASRNQPTESEIKTQMDTFKTEMDALIAKYPELKTAMPSAPMGGKMGRGMGQGQDPMNAILSGVSDTDKAAIEAIRTEYRAKQAALRTEEKTKIDTIIAKYPELKTKLDAMEANRPQMGRNGSHGGFGQTNSSTTKTN